MSNTIDDSTRLQKEYKNQYETDPYGSVSDSIEFVFKDEFTQSVPMYLLEKYPNSLLSLTYNDPAKFIKEKNAFFLGSPHLLIDKLIAYMEESLSLDSLSIHEVYSIYKTSKYFFHNDNYECEMMIYEYLVEAMYKIMKENNFEIEPPFLYNELKKRRLLINGIITKERNQLFLSYSGLFDLLNITNVVLEYSFCEDIPYEYIYPSNLHELFPKLEEYTIQPHYFSTKCTIQVKPIDPVYSIFYKQYLLDYYHKQSPKEYYLYQRRHTNYPRYSLNSYHIELCDTKKDEENNNINETSDIKKDEENNKNNNIKEIKIPMDIDEEIRKQKEEEKPILNITMSQYYSSEYNKQEMNKQNVDQKMKDMCNSDDILAYIANIPICKQLYNYDDKSFCGGDYPLQLNIPPFLNILEEGFFNTIQIIDLLGFITPHSFDVYKEVLKRILTTRIFANVTTIRIRSMSLFDYNHEIELLSVITREHFPKLHIYNLFNLHKGYSTEENELQSSLFPDSFMKLIDTIKISNFNLIEDIIRSKHNDPFYIEIQSLIIYDQPRFIELGQYGQLLFDEICFQFLESSFSNVGTPLIHLNRNEIKNIIIDIDLVYKNINSFEDLKTMYENMNFNKVNSVQLRFVHNTKNESIYYTKEYFSILRSNQYNNVEQLTIKDEKYEDCSHDYDHDYDENDYYKIHIHPEEIIMKENNQQLYHFLSLFSNHIQDINFSFMEKCFDSLSLLKESINLPLWNNVQNLSYTFENDIELKDILVVLVDYFKQNQLLHLKSLRIILKNKNFDYSWIFEFIDLLNANTSISLPYLDEFSIYFDSTNSVKRIPNMFESFPSLAFCFHKPILCINTCVIYDCIHEDLYYNYICEQLTQKYTNTCRFFIFNVRNSTDVLDTIISIITNGNLPHLKEFYPLFGRPTDFTKYQTLLDNYINTTNHQFRVSLSEPNFRCETIYYM
ncbi:hypothetical protein WA158_004004 [Blastocystis sp. Blastoise]